MVTRLGGDPARTTVPGSRRFVLKSAITYSGTNLIGQAATFLSGFFLRRVLPPELMAVWNLVVVVRGYLQAINLGALLGALRELPILRGQENTAEEVRVRSVALWYSLGEATVVALGLWACTLWRAPEFGTLKLLALLVTGVLVVLGKIQEAYITFFQGAQLYVTLSRVFLVSSLAYAIALPAGAVVAGVPGLLVAAVVAELSRGLWSAFQGGRAGLKTVVMFDAAVWKRLVTVGVGYRVADYPQIFFLSLDLLWVSRFLGLKGLGLYALAKSFYSQSTDITTRISTVLFTRTLMQHGGGVERDRIVRDMLRFMQFQLFVSIPLVCWAVASVGPFVIRYITPLYVESVPVLFVLLLGSFFISQNTNIYTLWIAEKRLISYGVSNLFGVLATGGTIAVMWFVLGRITLRDVALGTVVGYGLYFAYMVFSAGRELWGLKTSWTVLGEAVFAAGWMAAVLAFLAHGGGTRAGWKADLLHSGVLAMGGLIGLVPLMTLGVWITGTGTDLRLWVTRVLRTIRI